MFVFHARRAALAVAAIIVSGCSTNSVIGATSAQHDALQSVVRADTAVHATYFPGDKVFVSNFYRSEIDVYPAHRQNAAPVAVIHDGVSAPYNLAIDASGRLFVPNNNDTISIYLPGQTTPSKTLIEPVAGPGGLGVGVNVAVGAGDTVISVDHYASQVYEYLDGATNPTYEYEVDQAFGLAVDSRNDFYVGYSPG
ncbi:MAG TPA: hypothetical protein VEJ20_09500, partial [Candidatus Eremiobacteraceae bacterium]|nr:hypothetical protein [Candidatus Eremiobacteraceae bacterium]